MSMTTAIKSTTSTGIHENWRRMMKKKLSEMNVGDRAFLCGDLVELRNGGLSGGSENDLFLAHVAQHSDREWADAVESDVPDVIVDTDDVSGAEMV